MADASGARAVVETNLVGPMLVTAELLPLLRAARGRIVDVGSSSAVLATPFLAARRVPARRVVAADRLQALAVRLLPAGLLDRMVIRAVHGSGITPP